MNLDYKKYDSLHMFDTIFNFAEQLHEAMRIGENVTLRKEYKNIKNIVFVGMGGSAIAGDIVCLLSQHTTTIPMIVTRTYSLPNWVDKHTLVICLSYSGNTEETLSAFKEADEKNAHIIGITSGGKLMHELEIHHYDMITIPQGLPPRAALGYLAVPLLYVMRSLDLIENSVNHELEDAVDLLKKQRAFWSEISDNNEALQIAKQIYQSYPLIYGEAEHTSTIARRWRGQFAENSKMLASSQELPELDHNEIVGFDKNPDILKRFGVIWLIDKEMNKRMEKRLTITKDIINGSVAYQITIQTAGTSFTERMLYLIHLGDWVSFWCAILHKEDPTPVKRITALKELMSKPY